MTQTPASELSRAAESTVVTLAMSGDTGAFSEIVRRRQRRVRNFMYYLCQDPVEGDDLAQQVFLNAWRSIRRLRSAAAFEVWLRKIMVTTWLEAARRGKIETTDSDPDRTPGRTETTGQRMDLDAALGRLPSPVRLCVVLAYNEGMTHDEISAVTRLPPGTVKSHISRGSARLREVLSAYREGRLA